jgi:hypothetical protein
VHPFVDEAALLVVLILAGKRAQQVVIERRAAGGAAVGGRPVQLVHHFGDRAHVLRDDLGVHQLNHHRPEHAEGELQMLVGEVCMSDQA